MRLHSLRSAVNTLPLLHTRCCTSRELLGTAGTVAGAACLPLVAATRPAQGAAAKLIVSLALWPGKRCPQERG